MFGWFPDNVSTEAVFRALYWGVALAMVAAQLMLARGVRAGTHAREAIWAIVPLLLLLSFGTASSGVARARTGHDSPSSSAHDGERHGR